MTLKSQNDRQYRGLLWIGRLYRLAGWLGLVATVLIAIWAFANQWDSVGRYWTGVTFWTQLTHATLAGLLFLVIGLALSAVAFGISLGVQVGLTIMKNSQTQVELLRRLAQTQGENDIMLRLKDHDAESPDEEEAVTHSHNQRHYS